LHLQQPARRRRLCLRHRPRRGSGTVPPRSRGRGDSDTDSDPRPGLPGRFAGRGDRRRPGAGPALRGRGKVAIWDYGAEPGDGIDRRATARVGEHGLTADIEGLTIYYAPGGKGYLLASSQGSSTINVYERSGDHAYILTIDPKAAGTIDDIADSDGLDVTNQPTSSLFPRGFLVVQDGKNDGHQNFKLFAWEDVAGDRLVVDMTSSARWGTK
jgi:3-phytase